MTWYAAHLLLYTRFLDGVQDSYHVWENVVMVQAETSDEAYAIADKKGAFEASGSDGYTYDGRPAEWVYLGTRKLNECIEHFDPEWRRPGGLEEHGTEVTYSSFLLPDAEALQKLIEGRDVTVLYEGTRSDEDF